MVAVWKKFGIFAVSNRCRKTFGAEGRGDRHLFK